MANRFIQTHMKLPKGFEPVPPNEGTRAYDYLTGIRPIEKLLEDEKLAFIIDDKHPDGGQLYVFEDRSSVVFNPILG